MERACFFIRILPGTEASFDRVVPTMWPEMVAAFGDCGITDLTVFRRGTSVWQVLTAEPDAVTAFTRLDGLPVTARWGRELRSVVADIGAGAHRRWYRHIFSAPGRPQPGPFRRQLLTLVIDPERGAEYDARHAEPWPAMLEAIAEAGSVDSVGYRDGAQVVFAGRHHPDLATVYERISGIEVDARWGRSFEGIITTMTGPDGDLLLAEEVFHID